MTEKHAAEVLADYCGDPLFSADKIRNSLADMLRTIPALEAELMEQARIVGMGAEREARLMARVAELERERDALRKANDTFASASVLPDHLTIIEKAEVEALRADAEQWRFVRAQHEGDDSEAICVFAPVGANAGVLDPIGSMPGELDAFIKAARKS